LNRNFDEVWSDIRKRLMSGTLVRYWSAEEGYTGGAFRIDDVDGAAVIVRHGQMGYQRRVSKRDFQHLFALWGAYNRGTIGRVELGKRSENATYILSVLQWRNEAQSSPAPTLRISSVLVTSTIRNRFGNSVGGTTRVWVRWTPIARQPGAVR